MVQLYHIFLESIFFFNDTATTEIYPYCTLCPYPTLFRSLVLTRCGHLGTVQAQWTQRNVSMRSMIWVATGLLVFGLASAQAALISDPDSDAVNDAEQTQAYRALLHDAARTVPSARKSDGEGKRGSVRVARGGRRFNKQ